ncbi:hypothetical protein IJH10_00375 [Candidatus Saccharibacteria bacterium]|nr:hypothetical protein [Candidatus Saccharibacteria bacterium]
MVYRAKNKKQSKNHHVFLFIILALIVCAVVIVALLILNPLGGNKTTNNGQGTNNTSSSTDQKSDSSGTKEESNEENNSTEPTPEAEKNNTQYEGENPNNSESLTGIINYIGISDGTLSVRVSIEQSVAGTCVFTITTPSGKTINGSSAISVGPTSSFCSFSTPAQESGSWKVSVGATSSDKHGTITGEANL